MSFLLDTDTCVFWLRGNTAVRNHFSAVGVGAIAVSVVTLAELRYGASVSERADANHQAIDTFISSIALIGVDQLIARTFSDIKAELRSSGMLIEDFTSDAEPTRQS